MRWWTLIDARKHWLVTTALVGTVSVIRMIGRRSLWSLGPRTAFSLSR